MASIAGLKERFPEIPGADSFLQAAIDDATADVSPSVFGGDTERAIYYLAAHNATLLSGAQARGVSTVTAGQATISYGGAVHASSALNATGYGRMYVALARKYGGATIVGAC